MIISNSKLKDTDLTGNIFFICVPFRAAGQMVYKNLRGLKGIASCPYVWFQTILQRDPSDESGVALLMQTALQSLMSESI